METRILIAFATTYGSTKEVAEAIASTVREQGLAVDLQPARNVKSLSDYRAVILGTSLYIGHSHKDALNFLARHREVLTQESRSPFSQAAP